MFNITGSELIIVLLLGLVVLGPERLPQAARTVGKVMAQIRDLSNSFQRELKDAFDVPGEPIVRPARPQLTALEGGAGRPEVPAAPDHPVVIPAADNVVIPAADNVVIPAADNVVIPAADNVVIPAADNVVSDEPFVAADEAVVAADEVPVMASTATWHGAEGSGTELADDAPTDIERPEDRLPVERDPVRSEPETSATGTA